MVSALVLRLHVIAKFESHSVTVAPECAGNGRSFHRPRVPGTQWKRGAVGNAQFSGPRLRDLLLTAGLKTTARHVHGRAKLISSELKCRRMAAPPGQTQSWKRSKPVYAWRFWKSFWKPPRTGDYTIMSRATGSRGRIQPETACWNPGGYLYNAVDRAMIRVSV
jgi:hypothetical protein